MELEPELKIYLDNSQYVEVGGLHDPSVTPTTYENNATLTATMLDPRGVAVPGAQNMPGEYVAGSNGTYRFTWDPDEFQPKPIWGYTLDIKGTVDGLKYRVLKPVRVYQRRNGTEI